MDPLVVELIEAGFSMNAVEFKRLELLRSEVWNKLRRIFERFDALPYPTMSLTARPVEEDEAAYVADDGDRRYHGLDLTA